MLVRPPRVVTTMLALTLPWLFAAGAGVLVHPALCPEPAAQEVAAAPPTVAELEALADTNPGDVVGPLTRESSFAICTLQTHWTCVVPRPQAQMFFEFHGTPSPVAAVPTRAHNRYGLTLYGIRTGSPAHDLQLRNGDMLIGVDGERLDEMTRKDLADYAQDLRQRIEAGPTTMLLEIDRHGAQVRTQIMFE